MIPTVKKSLAIVASLLVFAITATPANNAEELVFSKTGGFMHLSGNHNGVSGTPFGFWIWCAFHASSASTPVTYQGAQVCQGSMYFYALGVPEHVVSVLMTQENPEGTYTLKVLGFKSPQQTVPDFSCILTNAGPPTSGPTNSVAVNCSFTSLGGGTGSAVVDGAVVQSTGPE